MAMSAWLVGRDEGVNSAGDIVLSETVTFYEVLNDKGQVAHTYVSDVIVTEGKLNVPKTDFSIWRNIEKGDEVLVGYERALTEFRARKAGIVPPPPRTNGPRPMVGPQGAN
jgi:hypothetical protein